jgi:hypothetical protein
MDEKFAGDTTFKQGIKIYYDIPRAARNPH